MNKTDMKIDFQLAINLGEGIAQFILKSEHGQDLGTISRALRFADEIVAARLREELKIPDLSQVSSQSAEANPKRA